MHTRQISSRKNHCSIGDLQCISTGVSGFSVSLWPRELSPPVPVFLEVLADAAGPVGAGLVVGYERTARQSFTEHRRQHLKYQHSAVYCHRPWEQNSWNMQIFGSSFVQLLRSNTTGPHCGCAKIFWHQWSTGRATLIFNLDSRVVS